MSLLSFLFIHRDAGIRTHIAATCAADTFVRLRHLGIIIALGVERLAECQNVCGARHNA